MSEDASKILEKALDKEEQVVYNALTDRKTGRQATYLRSPVKRLFPATTVQVFSASPVILPISRFPKQAYSVPTAFRERGTAPFRSTSLPCFIHQNIFAASSDFPVKRLLSLPEFVPGNADSAEAQSCVFPESATMRTRSSCRASVVPTRSGFSESGVAA